MRTVAKIKTHQMPDKMRLGLSLNIAGEKFAYAMLQFLARHSLWVAVLDFKTKGQQITQQSIRQLAAFFAGPSFEKTPGLWQQIGPSMKFMQQPALANPGFANQRKSLQPPLPLHIQQGLLQKGQFRIPPDHARFNALHAARPQAESPRAGLLHQVNLHRLRFTFDNQGRLRQQIEDAAHLAVGFMRDQDAARRRVLLQARRHVHRIPHHSHFANRTYFPQQNHSCMNPDAQRQAAHI